MNPDCVTMAFVRKKKDSSLTLGKCTAMGNHLVVADEVYKEFLEQIKDIKQPEKIYCKWQEVAENILGITDK